MSAPDLVPLLRRIIAQSQTDATFVLLAHTRAERIDLGPTTPRAVSVSEDQAATITVLSGKRYGTVTSNYLGEEGIPTLLNRAKDHASILQELPRITPFPAPASITPSPITDPGLTEESARGRFDLAREITEVITRGGCTLHGGLTVEYTTYGLAASTGLLIQHPRTVLRIDCRIIPADGIGASYLQHTSHVLDRKEILAKARAAVERCRRWTKPTDIPVKRMTALFSAQAIADMVFQMLLQFDRTAIVENRSFLRKLDGTTRLSSKMFEGWLSWHSDPWNGKAPSLPFTLQGFPLQPTKWIREGVIENIVVSPSAAAEDGSSVLPFPSNLIMTGGKSSWDSMIKTTERGVLVNGLTGLQQLDPTACRLIGSTRGGTFLIEKGKMTSALINLVMEETPIYLFELMEKAGPPELVHPTGSVFPMLVPPMRVRDVLFTRHTGLV